MNTTPSVLINRNKKCLKNILVLLFISLSIVSVSLAQQKESTESNYEIRDSVSIPTQSGIDISATIVRKETKTQTTIPLRVRLVSVKTIKFN